MLLPYGTIVLQIVSTYVLEHLQRCSVCDNCKVKNLVKESQNVWVWLSKMVLAQIIIAHFAVAAGKRRSNTVHLQKRV